MLECVVEGAIALSRAGVVHTELSAHNVLVLHERPWFIDL
jgi:serine/threonine-protein kinase RIO1